MKIAYTSLDDFREKMGQNRWFHNLDELLAITTMFARRIREQYDSILIQSRDGDDICAQISSLIQVFRSFFFPFFTLFFYSFFFFLIVSFYINFIWEFSC